MSLFLRVIPDWLTLVALASCVGMLVCRLWVLGPARETFQSIVVSKGVLFALLLGIGALDRYIGVPRLEE